MSAAANNRARIRVDAGSRLGELRHNWTYIGYDEINYTYVPEGRELLQKFGGLQEQPYHVRTHHLLCTGNGHATPKWGSTNAYLEDEHGTPVHDWAIVDRTFDTLLEFGLKPFVELGFMPQHLADPACYAIEDETWSGQHYRSTGWACPPRDYGRWYELIAALVRHCLERYGRDEIVCWYWELWNEPDIFYWRGTPDEFHRLYDYTAAAIKAVCPQAQIGGPATTNPAPGSRAAAFLDGFLAHCAGGLNACTGERGAPLDFVSFHVKGGGYRADPLHRKQDPPSLKRMLAHTRHGHEIIRRYAGFAGLPCILSEIDPDGWAAGGAWDNANLNFRNTPYYASFVAASFHAVSRYARSAGWDLRLLSWAFLFVGERCFEGTRTFSTQGVDKAILNLFRMYARMGRWELRFESSAARDPLQYADAWGRAEGPDISGFATLSDGRSLQILIYNHHDDWDRDDEYAIELEVANVALDAGELRLHHYRIDAEHSNAYAEWVRQGRPDYPTPGQMDGIWARAGLELLEPPSVVRSENGTLRLFFSLPAHAISLLVLETVP